jgi:protein phosphatase
MDPTKADTAEFHLPPQAPDESVPAVASALVRVDFGALSHQGKVRSNNEDHYLVVRFGRSLETLFTNLPEDALAPSTQEIGYGIVVADGVGGKAGGEVASRTAITTMLNLVLDTPDWMLKIGRREADEVLRRFAERYRQVDVAVSEQALLEPDLTGMGTTMTLACSLGADLILGHLGDSRAYFCRHGELYQVTRDHTLVQDMIEKGLLHESAAATHRWRHVLTRVLGGNWGAVEPELHHLWLADGDRLLLCTDGLTDMVDDDAIRTILMHTESSQAACQALVDLALQRGGKDNVTVALARYQFPS